MHSTDTFGTGGKNALVEALNAQGIEPVMMRLIHCEFCELHIEDEVAIDELGYERSLHPE